MRPGSIAVVLLGAALVTACRDSRTVTGPLEVARIDATTLSALPANGGVVPEVISTTSGETQIHLFTFSMGSASNVDIEGSEWGVWFGDADSLVSDPPTGNVSFRAYTEGFGSVYNLPSPGQYAAQWNGIRQAFLYFDPPVRTVSFLYASRDGMGSADQPDEAFWFRVKDTNGSTVLFDSIRSNNPGSYTADLVNWDTISVSHSSGEDLIASISFNGLMVIDDLKIVRAAPAAIVCDTVVRGSPSTCSVRPEVSANLTSVTDWRNVVDLGSSGIDTILGPANATEWGGEVAASGIVSAVGWIDSDSVLLHGSLHVLDRSGSEWRWSEDDWEFVQGSAPDCGLFSKLQISTSDIFVGIHMHAKYCLNGKIDPPPHVDPLSTTVRKVIADAGPNYGLWYVDSASYHMDTGSRINPSLLSSYVPLDNLHNADKNQCQQQGHSLQQANFYQYNELCRSADVDAWISGIWLHEGYGSTGGNGHESRLRVGAKLEENDPVAAVESLVHVSEQGLISAITGTIEIVDGDLDEAADGGHVLVRNNFAPMTFWLFNPGNGKFKNKVVDDVP